MNAEVAMPVAVLAAIIIARFRAIAMGLCLVDPM